MILATGKAPVGPWMEALEAKLGKLPGAYMLGTCADSADLQSALCQKPRGWLISLCAGLVLHGAQGETTHTRSLESDFASDIFAVGKRFSAWSCCVLDCSLH